MVDAILLGVLAVADLGFLIYLRWRRSKRVRRARIEASLTIFLRRQNGYELPKRRRLLLRAG